MSENNPFKKLPGGSAETRMDRDTSRPSPAPEPSPPQEIRDLCPFIGGMSVPVIDQNKIMRSVNPMDALQVGFQLVPCQRERCALWNTEAEACSVRLGMDALARLEAPLLALGKTFGARG